MQVLDQAQGWAVILTFAVIMMTVMHFAFRSRAVNTRVGYLLGGGKMPWWFSGAAIAATWTWAIAVFVGAERAYLNGWVGLFWFAVPNILALILFSFGAKKVVHKYPNGFTLSGLMRERYSPRVQRAYHVTLISLATASCAVQLLAGGLIASNLTGINFFAMTVALAVIAMAYTMRPGFGASVVSDFMNLVFIVLFGGTIAVWIFREAGWDTFTAGLSGASGEYTGLIGGAGGLLFFTFAINSIIGLLTGPWGDQNYWQFSWATDHRHVQRAFLLGAFIFAFIPLTMGVLGIIAAGAGLQPVTTQLTNLAAVMAFLPEWTLYPFMLYVFGVLITTIDSNYSVIAAFMGHDFSRGKGDRQAVRRARLAVIAVTAAAVIIANYPGITLLQLFFIYGTFRIATFLPTVFTLFTDWTSERGMFWGITAACVIGVPMMTYGNLSGDWRYSAGAAMLTMIISGFVSAFLPGRRPAPVFEEDARPIRGTGD